MLPSNLLRCSLAASVLISAVATQTVTATARAITPLTVTAGTPAVTQTLPIGPLPVAGQVLARQSPAEADCSWTLYSGSSECGFLWSHLLTNQASAGPHEVLVEWTATSQVEVALSINSSTNGTAGSTLPAIAIDIGNTGTYQPLSPTSPPITTGRYTLGPQPLQIRVRFEGSVGNGSLHHNLKLAFVPQNDLAIYPLGTGCLGQTMALAPHFVDTGLIATSVSPPINIPTVLVVGFTAQPQTLPPLFGFPCLLIPRPDVLIPFFSTQAIDIPLPAAVRPVDLWIQRGGLGFGQLVTSDAYYVRAL